jgi:hypothetical protein
MKIKPIMMLMIKALNFNNNKIKHKVKGKR